MHWVLHDWSDDRCRQILAATVRAMEPGYSRLIINEYILPNTKCPLSYSSMSIMMTIQVGAYERTEQEWWDLLGSVGLTVVQVSYPPEEGEGVIEAVKYMRPPSESDPVN